MYYVKFPSRAEVQQAKDPQWVSNRVKELSLLLGGSYQELIGALDVAPDPVLKTFRARLPGFLDLYNDPAFLNSLSRFIESTIALRKRVKSHLWSNVGLFFLGGFWVLVGWDSRAGSLGLPGIFLGALLVGLSLGSSIWTILKIRRGS